MAINELTQAEISLLFHRARIAQEIRLLRRLNNDMIEQLSHKFKTKEKY